MSDLTKVMLVFFIIAMCGQTREYRAVGWLVVLVGVVIQVAILLITTTVDMVAA